jgi:Xaa-Pro dipeptidase
MNGVRNGKKGLRWKKMEYVLHPRSEIDIRIKKFQGQIEDLTGAILFESVDMGYFSGTSQDGLVYIPKYDEPVVMVRKSLQRAVHESPLDVRSLKSLKNLKADLGITLGAVIGLELDMLPYNNYSRVANALGDVKLVDVSERIKHIRSVKSEFEIGLIKRAAEIVDVGISSIQDHIKEGMSEIELATKMEAAIRSMGHQGIVRFRRFNQALPMGHLMSGPNAAVPSFVASPTGGVGMSLFHPQGPGFRKIKQNEPILVDHAGVYNGYIADETRIFALGRISHDLEDAHLPLWRSSNPWPKSLFLGRLGGVVRLVRSHERAAWLQESPMRPARKQVRVCGPRSWP